MAPHLKPLRGTLTAWLGRIMAGVRLNRIQPRERCDGLLLVAKRRRPFSRWAIWAGNRYLRRIDANVRVLRDAEWQARELEVHRKAFKVECALDGRGWLLLPRWPGVLLSEYASDGSLSRSERMRAIASASRSLSKLHRIEVASPDGSLEPFSHGDATLRNVVFDADTGLCHWFDLDTAHIPRMAALDRHVDDLRALLYSAIGTCLDVPASEIVEYVREGYDAPEAWDRLRVLLMAGYFHANTYHLAQACPPDERRRQAERRLLGPIGGDIS